MNFNRHEIIGRVTRDPEVRTIESGMIVANFSVATNNEWKDKSGEKHSEATFHDIVAWGGLAEICGKHLKKGQLVFCSGRVQEREWEAPDGSKRRKREIVLADMQMGQKASGTSESSGAVEYAAKKGAQSVEQPNEINVENIPF